MTSKRPCRHRSHRAPPLQRRQLSVLLPPVVSTLVAMLGLPGWVTGGGTNGSITQYPAHDGGPHGIITGRYGITAGPEDHLRFIELGADEVGRSARAPPQRPSCRTASDRAPAPGFNDEIELPGRRTAAVAAVRG